MPRKGTPKPQGKKRGRRKPNRKSCETTRVEVESDEFGVQNDEDDMDLDEDLPPSFFDNERNDEGMGLDSGDEDDAVGHPVFNEFIWGLNYSMHPDVIPFFWASVNQYFQELLEIFIISEGWGFQQFLSAVNKMQLAQIYRCAFTPVGSASQKGRHFRLVFQVLFEASKFQWLAPWRTRNSIGIKTCIKRQIGGLFLTHYLYSKQPEGPLGIFSDEKQKIHIDPEDSRSIRIFLNDVEQLVESGKGKELKKEVKFVFLRLYQRGSFERTMLRDDYSLDSAMVHLHHTKTQNRLSYFGQMKDLRDKLLYLTYQGIGNRTFQEMLRVCNAHFRMEEAKTKGDSPPQPTPEPTPLKTAKVTSFQTKLKQRLNRHLVMRETERVSDQEESPTGSTTKPGTAEENPGPGKFPPDPKPSWTVEDVEALRSERDLSIIAFRILEIIRYITPQNPLTPTRLIDHVQVEKQGTEKIEKYKGQAKLQHESRQRAPSRLVRLSKTGRHRVSTADSDSWMNFLKNKETADDSRGEMSPEEILEKLKTHDIVRVHPKLGFKRREEEVYYPESFGPEFEFENAEEYSGNIGKVKKQLEFQKRKLDYFQALEISTNESQGQGQGSSSKDEEELELEVKEAKKPEQFFQLLSSIKGHEELESQSPLKRLKLEYRSHLKNLDLPELSEVWEKVINSEDEDHKESESSPEVRKCKRKSRHKPRYECRKEKSFTLNDWSEAEKELRMEFQEVNSSPQRPQRRQRAIEFYSSAGSSPEKRSISSPTKGPLAFPATDVSNANFGEESSILPTCPSPEWSHPVDEDCSKSNHILPSPFRGRTRTPSPTKKPQQKPPRKANASSRNCRMKQEYPNVPDLFEMDTYEFGNYFNDQPSPTPSSSFNNSPTKQVQNYETYEGGSNQDNIGDVGVDVDVNTIKYAKSEGTEYINEVGESAEVENVEIPDFFTMLEEWDGVQEISGNLRSPTKITKSPSKKAYSPKKSYYPAMKDCNRLHFNQFPPHEIPWDEIFAIGANNQPQFAPDSAEVSKSVDEPLHDINNEDNESHQNVKPQIEGGNQQGFVFHPNDDQKPGPSNSNPSNVLSLNSYEDSEDEFDPEAGYLELILGFEQKQGAGQTQRKKKTQFSRSERETLGQELSRIQKMMAELSCYKKASKTKSNPKNQTGSLCLEGDVKPNYDQNIMQESSTPKRGQSKSTPIPTILPTRILPQRKSRGKNPNLFVDIKNEL